MQTYRDVIYQIKARGSSGFQLSCTVGTQRVRKALRGATSGLRESEAKRVIDSLLDGDEWTLQRAVDATASARWRGTKGERTALRNCDDAFMYFGASTPVRDITTERIDSYVEHLTSKGFTPATVNRKLAALSRVLRTCAERGRLPAVPHMPRQREYAGRVRYLTSEEERTVVRWFSDAGMGTEAALVVFLVDTGLRLGEALRLEWRDCDVFNPDHTARPTVTVWATKGNQPRTIPLTERATQALVEREDTRGPFRGTKKSTMEQRWQRMRHCIGMAGDQQFVIHALRHTCASRLVQRGVPLKVVQEWMGHRAIQTTLRYAHLHATSLDAARAALEPQQE